MDFRNPGLPIDYEGHIEMRNQGLMPGFLIERSTRSIATQTHDGLACKQFSTAAWCLALVMFGLFFSGCGNQNPSMYPGQQNPIITSVTLTCNPSSITTTQISACTSVVTGVGSYSSSVTWSVSPGSVGTVNSTGVFTPSAAGTAVITAKSTQDATKSGSASVIVTVPISITSVSANCASQSLLQNQTSTCTATVSGTGNFNNAVTWSASPASLGSISSSGVFTPAATGTATVTATSVQDATKSGTATIIVNPFPTPTMPVIVPSILLRGRQTQVTVTCFVRGAVSNTQVQLFSLASGAPILVGTMNDNGQNGVYTILTNLTPPTASSLPLEIVATTGTNSTETANLSVQLVEIPSYVTNSDVNQAESQLYSTAIETRTSFLSPVVSNPALLSGISTNLATMFEQFAGVVSQNTSLQAMVSPLMGSGSGARTARPRPQGIVQGILDFIFDGLLTPAQNAYSCNQLIQSLGGFRNSSTIPVLAPDDPGLQQFAQELASICNTSASCQGAFGVNDFLTGNVAAAEWAHEYVVSGGALTLPIDGCGGGVAQSLSNVAVTDGVTQFTDLGGDALNDLAGGGQISDQVVGYANDTLVGWVVDNSGNTKLAVGTVGGNQTFAAPAGTYNLAVSFGGSTANATITKTPVYPNSTTNISPTAGANITVTPPYVTGLTPTSAQPGAAATITGTGFAANISGDDVTFNGVAAQIVSSTATSIQAIVPLGASSGPISVATSAGSTISSASFTVTGSSGSPAPAITSLYPNSESAGSSSQLLIINGTGFVLSSTVTFNGTTHATNFVGADLLTISLDPVDLSKAGSYAVVVTNPSPGGGASAPAAFIVGSSSGTGSGDWTWMSGSDQQQQKGVYGTKGIAASINVPGARSSAVSWVDRSGNFWLFGGNGYDSTGSGGALNDLWEYAPIANMWTWITGSETVNATGVYGTPGSASSTNVPSAREDAISWTDAIGMLWLYGGFNFADLWKFSPADVTWTCVSGCGETFVAPVYGTKGNASSTNTPGTRSNAAGWTDADGNLWLLGGSGFLNGYPAFFGDLWEYTPRTGLWTWIGGSNTTDPASVYGTQGIPSPANTPGVRLGSVTWTGVDGSLWLFGGWNPLSNSAYGAWFNDLWTFNRVTGLWTWMSGSDTDGAPGVYGTQGVAAISNVPRARAEAVGWLGTDGSLWLFGGGTTSYMLNDLWKYNIQNGEWTWTAGSNLGDQTGSFGTKGVANLANSPSAKSGAVGFSDLSGHCWLFGGMTSVIQNSSAGAEFNDLWQFQP